MNNDLRPKERFSGLADIYAKGRPDYPDDAIDFILKHCQLKAGDLLVDIGSGTGISARAFSKKGLKVIGIEPNKEMREQALLSNQQLKTLTYQLPIYQDGSAEVTGLSDNCTDAILAAQAFHWFDTDKALSEFVRILKPGGWVVLLWNEGNHSDSFTKNYYDLLAQYSHQSVIAKLRKTKSGNTLFKSPLFRDGKKWVFANEQFLDEQGLCTRALSASYIPKEPATQKTLATGLTTLFQQNQKDGLVSIKYNLELYIARCL